MPRRKPAAASLPTLTGPKSNQLRTLLSSRAGTTVADLSVRLGWQTHTTRAALTRLKQAGITIEKLAATEGTRQSRYRLAESKK